MYDTVDIVTRQSINQSNTPLTATTHSAATKASGCGLLITCEDHDSGSRGFPFRALWLGRDKN